MSGYKAERYIEKAHRGEIELTDEEWEAVFDRLNAPFGVVNYGSEGKVSIENTDRGMSFEYLPLDKQGRLKVGYYRTETLLALDNDPDFSREDVDRQPLIDSNNWREARNIKIRLSGVLIDISAVLPENARIFFCPAQEDIITGGSICAENAVYILGDINNLGAVLTLLHEIGHLHDDKRLKEEGKKSLIEPGEYSAEAEKLRSERSASAFALSVLRPILLENPQLKNDAFAFLKSHALQTYYNSTKKKVENNESLKRNMAKDIASGDAYADERQPLDDWEKWRSTPAYTEWRSKEENRELDEYDEFGVWQEWVRQSGYDYWKDIEGGEQEGVAS